MRVVGIDPATVTGLVEIDESALMVRCEQGKAADYERLLGGAGQEAVHIFAERPFVGDNRAGAIRQALAAGMVVERVAAWYGVPWHEVRWLEPSQWRREVGCPLRKVEAKEWCVRMGRLACGQESFLTKRGADMVDAAEAYWIARAGLSLLRRSDAGG